MAYREHLEAARTVIADLDKPMTLHQAAARLNQRTGNWYSLDEAWHLMRMAGAGWHRGPRGSLYVYRRGGSSDARVA